MQLWLIGIYMSDLISSKYRKDLTYPFVFCLSNAIPFAVSVFLGYMAPPVMPIHRLVLVA